MSTKRKPTPKTVEYQLWQNGAMVASCYGPAARAKSDIQHYAFVYGQDGPVEILKTGAHNLDRRKSK